MRKILQVGKDVKARRSRVRELMNLKLSSLELDIKLQLIQELIPLGLMHIGEILTEEVKALAGDRYKRNGKPGHVRWTKQWGSVYIGEGTGENAERLNSQVTRVYRGLIK